MTTPIIALMTDFGSDSHYPGAIKGVILNIHPEARIVDVTHDITPFNVMQATYVLDNVQPYYPKPTIFVCVIDPEVGSQRRPVIAVGESHYYVCPDNGILTKVIESDSINRIIHVEEDHYFLSDLSSTFHGRDIFAPVAAWLSKQLGADRFGEPIEDPVKLAIPKVKIVADRTLKIPIMFADHFGNLVTFFEKSFLAKARERYPGTSMKVKAGDILIDGLSSQFSDVANTGDPLFYFGSMDLLEVAVREGNAAEKLKLKAGDTISIYLGE